MVCRCLLFCIAWMCCFEEVYIDVFYCDIFSVVNVYLDHLKLCVLMVEGMSVVVNFMLFLMSVMSQPALLLLLFAFQSMFISICVSRDS